MDISQNADIIKVRIYRTSIDYVNLAEVTNITVSIEDPMIPSGNYSWNCSLMDRSTGQYIFDHGETNVSSTPRTLWTTSQGFSGHYTESGAWNGPSYRLQVDAYLETNDERTFQPSPIIIDFYPDNIDRRSTMSLSASSVALGSNSIAVAITPKVSSFTHKLYTIWPDNTAYYWARGVGTSASLAFPNDFANNIVGASSAAITIRLVTVNSAGTELGQVEYPVTVTIPDTADFIPGISGIVLDDTAIYDSSTSKSYLQKFGGLVEGYSIPRIAWTETGKYGAAIVSRKVVGIYQQASGTPYVIPYSTANPAVLTKDCYHSEEDGANVTYLLNYRITITDSRGKTYTTDIMHATPIRYSAIKFSATPSIKRSGATAAAAGETYLAISYAAVVSAMENPSTKAEQNFTRLDVYVYNSTTSQYDLVHTYGNTASEDAATDIIIGDGSTEVYSASSTYQLKLKLSDLLTSTEYEYFIPTAKRLMSFEKNGGGISIGEICTEDGLSVAEDWPVKIKDNLTVGGTLAVTGNETVGGNLTVTGKLDGDLKLDQSTLDLYNTITGGNLTN